MLRSHGRKPATPDTPALTQSKEAYLDPLRAQRRPRMVALGITMIAVAALGGVALVNTLSHSDSVLALAQDVARGEQIQADDLVSVEVASGADGLNVLPATAASDVIGSLAASDLHAGSTLTPDSITSTIVLEEGSSLVGVALSPSQAPGASLSDGDQVTLVQVSTVGATSTEAPRTWSGTVVSVHPSAADSTVQIVDVQVARADAAQVASLAAGDQIALVLDAR